MTGTNVPQTPPQEKTLLIGANLAQAIANYLQERPFKEVYLMVVGLAQLKEAGVANATPGVQQLSPVDAQLLTSTD